VGLDAAARAAALASLRPRHEPGRGQLPSARAAPPADARRQRSTLQAALLHHPPRAPPTLPTLSMNFWLIGSVTLRGGPSSTVNTLLL
jgi:hypothetical protein